MNTLFHRLKIRDLLRKESYVIAKTRFQTDAFKPACNWLTIPESLSDCLRAPSWYNQFENPPKMFLLVHRDFLWQISPEVTRVQNRYNTPDDIQ